MKSVAQLVLDEADIMDVVAETETASFESFDLPEKLQQSLKRMQFKTPTPIQAQTVPLAMKGHNILGSAQTGTGKTGAFGIPLVAKLMADPRLCALVMTPTRELAQQVMTALQQMIPVPNIKTALLIGGESMPKQFKQLQMRPRLIVGTPGRINDHLNRQTVDLRFTRFLVLDETDRMLDMGFGVQIDKILAYMPSDNRQTLMFSATLPNSIIKMSEKYMQDAVRIAVGSTTTPTDRIKQEVIQTSDSQKYDHLVEQLDKRTGSVIVFVRTKHGADRMAQKLTRDGYVAEPIHGDLAQRKRDRAIQAFRDKEFRILVATDIAARGLDVPHVEHVVNYDLPQVPEDYIHRIGRTARAGAEGAAVNLVSPSENGKWKAIQRLINNGESSEESFKGGPAKKGRSGFAPKGNGFKPRFGERNERYADEKPRFSERSNSRYSDDKPRFSDRNERPSYGDKPRFSDRNERSYGDKPRFSDRNERPSYGDKPRSSDRNERSYDDRPRSSERSNSRYSDDRPRFSENRSNDNYPSDNRGGDRKFGDKKPGGFKKFGGNAGSKSGPRSGARTEGGRSSAPRNSTSRSNFGGAKKSGPSRSRSF